MIRECAHAVKRDASLLQFSNASLPVTIFAPTDAGILATMRQLNLNMSSLQQSPNTLTAILKYHVLPSPLMVSSSEHDAGEFAAACAHSYRGCRLPQQQTNTWVGVNSFALWQSNGSCTAVPVAVMPALLSGECSG